MDHDRLFKTLLTTFFVEFIQLFVPDLADEMDADVELLDKEIFTDLASGERHEVDLLAKVRFSGLAAFFLIHLENQAKAADDFAARMFRYFARLHEKFGLPVFPIALLSYDSPKRADPGRYQVVFRERTVLDFAYDVVQLNQLNWRDFLRVPNPVASALMVKMRIEPQDRPRVKLECLRMLATLKLDPARSTLIGTFMNSYLKLTAAEHAVYQKEIAMIAPKEQEEVLVLTNEWIEEGMAKGVEIGNRRLVARQLSRRFGPLPSDVQSRIDLLDASSLEDLGEALLDFHALADVEGWLDRRK